MAGGFRRGGPRVLPSPFLTLRRTDKVVQLGDSITSPAFDCFAPLRASINGYFGCTGNHAIPTYVNSGVSGNQTADVVGNENARVITHAPTVLIDFLGFNDCHNNGVTPIATAQSVANKTSYFNTILAALPNLRVLMVGPMIYGGVRPDGSNAFDTSLTDHNAAFAAFAAARGWPYVDLRTKYFAEWITEAQLTTDTIHPTDPLGDIWISAAVERYVYLDPA